MKRLFFAIAILASVPLRASNAVLAYIPSRDLVIAAQAGAKTTAYRAGTAAKLWTADGVDSPRVIAHAGDRAIVLDSLNNEVLSLSLVDGTSKRFAVAATPVAAAFLGDDAYVLSRDGRRLQRLGRDGVVEQIETPADSAFLAVGTDRLYVYGRSGGVLEEFRGRPLTVTRRVEIPPFAADMESDHTALYLLYPRAGKMTVVLLRDFRAESQPVGAVPVDAAIEGTGTAITAGSLVVADPSSKRIWRSERSQSLSAAVSRGFIRGLLGLGLYHPSSPQFPTGVDRVAIDRFARLAYDSSTGSLFRFDGRKPRLVARDVAPWAFAATPSGIAVWDPAVNTVVYKK